jgi:hypothetical protein
MEKGDTLPDAPVVSIGGERLSPEIGQATVIPDPEVSILEHDGRLEQLHAKYGVSSYISNSCSLCNLTDITRVHGHLSLTLRIPTIGPRTAKSQSASSSPSDSLYPSCLPV